MDAKTHRRSIFAYNPGRAAVRLRQDEKPVYTVFDYNPQHLTETTLPDEPACKTFVKNGHVTWLNIDGLIKEEVESLCRHYSIHPLIVEDILSQGQRAKMDEAGNIIYALLPMLFYDEVSGAVEAEQVSIVLGKDFVLSFQEDKERDAFDPIRQKLRANHERLRRGGPDYLCYALLDVIVDGYFDVLEKLAHRIEMVEDKLLLQESPVRLGQVSLLRKEVMLLRHSILPVREVIGGFVRSDSEFLQEGTVKYFKDVQDHIIQAADTADNNRDMVLNLQDLFLNRNNLRLNEVIKVFTIITTLLAPATVIGGIFGMNFEVIPLMHHKLGFYMLVSAMFIIPLFMLYWFKKKRWF